MPYVVISSNPQDDPWYRPTFTVGNQNSDMQIMQSIGAKTNQVARQEGSVSQNSDFLWISNKPIQELMNILEKQGYKLVGGPRTSYCVAIEAGRLTLECRTWDTASGPRTSYCEAIEAGGLTLECPTWDTASGPRTSNCEAIEAGRLTLV